MHDDPLAKMGAFRLTNNMNNARHMYSGQATSSPHEQLLCSWNSLKSLVLFPLHSTREQKRTCRRKPAVMQIFGKTKLVQVFALNSQ
jgi:hypothetical protein